MIKTAIQMLMSKKNLTKQESYETMIDIMTGQATPSQIGGFLSALAMKGETIEEIAGCALAMRDSALPLVTSRKNLIDTCGTGGDGQSSLNISTGAALIAAGAGFTVAKHGNRSVSSHAGSADVLEALGVKIDCPSAAVELSLDQSGIGFLFAQSFHPAMKFAMPARKELGIRTIFNILGPLTNPARVKVQVIGVFNPAYTKILADVLKEMGHTGGLVLHSHGWDEIMLDGKTMVSELFNGKIRHYELTNKDFGLPKVAAADLKGIDLAHNTRILQAILEGVDHPARPVIIANAAAAIWIGERVYGNKKATLKDSVSRAQKALDSGAALKKLRELAEHSNSLN